jgi:hypothetical protein
VSRSPRALDPNPQGLNKGSEESWHDGKDLMVKMGKSVQIFKNLFFRDEFSEKIVKQITSPKSALNYRLNQPCSLSAMSYPAPEPRS